MNLSDKAYQKAKTAASADELMKFAADEGMSLSKDEAEKYFSFLHTNGRLSDEEVETVSGGKGKPDPKYVVTQKVYFNDPQGVTHYGRIISVEYVDFQQAYYYRVEFNDDLGIMKFPLESSVCPAHVYF